MRVMQQKHMFWWLFCCVFVVLFNYTTNIAKNIVSYVLVCFYLFDSQMLSIDVLSFTCVLYSSYSKP